MSAPRVLIVSENISMRMGGESSLPFYYAKMFSRRGVEVWLACHERVRSELLDAFPDFGDRIRFVADTNWQKTVFRWCSRLPYRIGDLLGAQVIHVSTQKRIRSIAVDLARAGKIDVLFEPAPITPKGLSFMYDIGVPVVIGPLCGGMNFPPAFRDLDSRLTRLFVAAGRRVSDFANRRVPGKLRANVVLVANALTAGALPRGCSGRVVYLFESGIDLDLWETVAAVPSHSPRPSEDVRFMFSGRFVDWKGIQYLVPAFQKVVSKIGRCSLELIGDGDLADEVRKTVASSGLQHSVRMHGWLSRTEAAQVLRDADVFVMPSLRECGGTAILEAMAMGKPIITTNWGGPADYVDSSCGILVDPSSKDAFIEGLAAAMIRLASSPELREAMGEAGRRRIRRDYLAWDDKADYVLSLLSETAALGPKAVPLPADIARNH
jgi:glycosyltransferase involved in cell wall biosynthesis